MVFFSFLFAKKNRRLFGLILFFSCVSCQSLNQSKKPLKIRETSTVIDNSYFEQQALTNYLKAENAFFKSDRTSALKRFKKARLFAPQSAHFQKRIAELYETEGLLSLAINEYKSLIKKTSHKREFLKKLTDLYAKQQLNNKALEQNDLLLKQEPYSFPLILKKTTLLINQKNWETALKTLKTAEKQAVLLEEIIQSLLFRAYVFAKQGKIKDSLKVIQKINKLDFPEEKLVLQVAVFYKNFDTEWTRRYLESFQKERGVTAATSRVLLEGAISSKKWAKAMHHIQQLEDLGQMREQHYFYKALFLLKEKQYNKATPYLKDLQNQQPQNGHYNYLLALNYEKNQQWPKAIKTYQKVPPYSPYFLAAHLQIAQLWQKQGEYEKSFELLNHLAFNQPASPQAVLLYAESLWDTGNKRQAVSVLTKALKYHPDHLDILFLRGFYFKESGSEDLAIKDMSQILKIHSNHREALKLVSSLQAENS